jgi:hypothetical protein
MPSAEFEPAILATKRPQTWAFDRAATGIGFSGVIKIPKYKTYKSMNPN